MRGELADTQTGGGQNTHRAPHARAEQSKTQSTAACEAAPVGRHLCRGGEHMPSSTCKAQDRPRHRAGCSMRLGAQTSTQAGEEIEHTPLWVYA
eukprot:358531-Chlamydomonas_euryale.AAC.4